MYTRSVTKYATLSRRGIPFFSPRNEYHDPIYRSASINVNKRKIGERSTESGGKGNQARRGLGCRGWRGGGSPGGTPRAVGRGPRGGAAAAAGRRRWRRAKRRRVAKVGVEGVMWCAGVCCVVARTHTRTRVLACSPRLRLRRSLAI